MCRVARVDSIISIHRYVYRRSSRCLAVLLTKVCRHQSNSFSILRVEEESLAELSPRDDRPQPWYVLGVSNLNRIADISVKSI